MGSTAIERSSAARSAHSARPVQRRQDKQSRLRHRRLKSPAVVSAGLQACIPGGPEGPHYSDLRAIQIGNPVRDRPFDLIGRQPFALGAFERAAAARASDANRSATSCGFSSRAATACCCGVSSDAHRTLHLELDDAVLKRRRVGAADEQQREDRSRPSPNRPTAIVTWPPMPMPGKTKPTIADDQEHEADAGHAWAGADASRRFASSHDIEYATSGRDVRRYRRLAFQATGGAASADRSESGGNRRLEPKQLRRSPGARTPAGTHEAPAVRTESGGARRARTRTAAPRPACGRAAAPECGSDCASRFPGGLRPATWRRTARASRSGSRRPCPSDRADASLSESAPSGPTRAGRATCRPAARDGRTRRPGRRARPCGA